MSPFRPWYCDYLVAEDGSIRLRIAWQDFPSQSVVHDHLFQRLADVPAWVREMLLDAMARTGGGAGRFDFPADWPPVEHEQLRNLSALAPLRRSRSVSAIRAPMHAAQRRSSS